MGKGGAGPAEQLRVHVADRGVATTPTKPRGASKYIGMRQATNIMDAVKFAKLIGVPLMAHLTIHWAYTNAGDDPHGNRFAKIREGLDKWLRRHGIVFTACWCRERQCGGLSDVVHCHLLFYLPVEYRTGARLCQVEAAIARLVELHGNGYWAEQVIKLVIHDTPPYPDGKYLIKGGGLQVWKKFGVRKEHRRLQGLIQGKRCGVTENISAAARKRSRKRRDGSTNAEALAEWVNHSPYGLPHP